MHSPSELGPALIDAGRDVGTERGALLAQWVIAARWRSLGQSDVAKYVWRDVIAARDEDTLKHALARVLEPGDLAESASFYEGSQRDFEVLHRLVDLVHSATPDDADCRNTHDAARVTLEAAFDFVCRSGGREQAAFETPAGLADLMATLTVRPGDTVVDPSCGAGSLLRAAARTSIGNRLYGVEVDDVAASRARLRLALAGLEADTLIRGGDGFVEPLPNADTLLLQPRWGVRLEGESLANARALLRDADLPSGIGSRSDWHWAALAITNLRPGGRAAVVLPPGTAGRVPDVQRGLLDRGLVDAVIALPPGFLANTRVGGNLWLLRDSVTEYRPGPVLLLNAAGFMTREGRNHLTFTGDAVSQIASLVEQFRVTGTVDAPPHVAKVEHTFALRDHPRGAAPLAHLDEAPQEVVFHPAPARSLLTEIRLSRYKAFGDEQRLPLAPLTLLYGANSAGKSSVIQSLLLLKQSVDSDRLVTQGSLVNVGGFAGLVHKHEGRSFDIGLTFGALTDWWVNGDGTVNPALQRGVDFSFSEDERGIGRLQAAKYRFADAAIDFERNSEGDGFTTNLDRFAGFATAAHSHRLHYPHDDERRGGDPGRHIFSTLSGYGVEHLTAQAIGLLPTNFDGLPRSVTTSGDVLPMSTEHQTRRAMQLPLAVSSEVRQLLHSVTWLGPLRPAPQRVYDRATADPNLPGHDVALRLYDHDSVVREVNDWLQRLDVPYELDVVAATSGQATALLGDLVAITLTDKRSGVTVTPADVGFGVSQVLPIVVELIARSGSVILIEQPETHLHPRLQARLADLLIDSTQFEGRGNQAIVETHSEHLILRIQRRIRRGLIAPEDVAVLYVDQLPDGETVVRPLRLDAQGEFIDEWPGGFFDDRLDELFGED